MGHSVAYLLQHHDELALSRN